MVMKQRSVVSLASDHFNAWQASVVRAQMLDMWARGENDDPSMPAKAESSAEYQALREVSPTPWAHLIVSSVAQAIAVTEQRDEDGKPTTTFKTAWGPNSMLSRQQAITRGALAQNVGYATTLPGRRPHTDALMPVIRGASATQMAAFYDDEATDDFARFAMHGTMQRLEDGTKFIAMKVYDEDAIYYLSCDPNGGSMTFIETRIHGVGVTPVHRFSPRLDLEGRAWGEVEPFLPNLRRLDQDVFDRLVVQRFNSWRVRYAAGILQPNTPEERAAASLALRIEDLLVSEDPNTKFGTLDPTDMDPYIKAHDSDVRDLAAVSQTPPHHLLGQMVNLSAEALVAAETSLMRKVDEYRNSFAQSWDSVLRSCAFIMANSKEVPNRAEFEAEATNYDLSIRWKDTSSRSLAQAADALGKIADMLNVPVEMLWEELPFWKKGDTDRAKGILEESGADALLMQFLDEATANSRRQETANVGPAD